MMSRHKILDFCIDYIPILFLLVQWGYVVIFRPCWGLLALCQMNLRHDMPNNRSQHYARQLRMQHLKILLKTLIHLTLFEINGTKLVKRHKEDR